MSLERHDVTMFSIFQPSPVLLTTRTPSPTTTLYTCSTQRRTTTQIGRILQIWLLAFKIILACICATYLGTRLWSLWGCATSSSFHEKLAKSTSYESPSFQRIVGDCIAESIGSGQPDSNRWATALAILGLWVLQRRDYVEESLLVIQGLGIQISTSSPSYLSTPSTRFISTSQVQDIFIHEAFIGFEVKFYLAVIVEGEKDAVVIFPRLMPKRDILERVWRGSRSVLYHGKKLG